MFTRGRSPHVVHLKTRILAGVVTLTWDVRGARALRWRVLRSELRPADGPFDDTIAGGGQTLVSDQATPGTHDEGCTPGTTAHYTIFAEDEGGQWHRAAPVKLAVRPGGRRDPNDFEAGSTGASWVDRGLSFTSDNHGTPRS